MHRSRSRFKYDIDLKLVVASVAHLVAPSFELWQDPVQHLQLAAQAHSRRQKVVFQAIFDLPTFKNRASGSWKGSAAQTSSASSFLWRMMVRRSTSWITRLAEATNEGESLFRSEQRKKPCSPRGEGSWTYVFYVQQAQVRMIADISQLHHRVLHRLSLRRETSGIRSNMDARINKIASPK